VAAAIALVASGLVLAMRSPSMPIGADPRASGPGALVSVVRDVWVHQGIGPGGEAYTSIQTVRADGSGLRTLLSGGRDVFFTGLAWSPDGTHVAFTRYAEYIGPPTIPGPAATYVMAADGTGMRKIRDCPRGGCPLDLAWSPDGGRIAYRDGQSLAVMQADGSDAQVIYPCRGHGCEWVQGPPSWSPDGSELVFPGMDQDDVGGLFVIGADGGPLGTVTRCYSELCYGGDREASPAWSPDGGLIAFHRERNLFLVHPDGTGLLQLSSCPKVPRYDPCRADDPAWSSDGAEIAYVARDGLHAVGRDGSKDRLITPLPAEDAEHAYSFCCVSWKPVPGVRPVASLPGAGPSGPAGIGVAPSPPRGVGTSIVASDWPQFRGSAAHTGLNPAEGAISPATVARLAQRWVSSIGDEAVLSQSPVVAGGQVFVGAYDGNLYAFAGPGCGAGVCPPEWAGRTGGPIQGTPAVAGGSAFVGSSGGLYAFDASGCGHPTCASLWVGKTGGPIGFSSPTVAGGLVFVGSGDYDSRLYAFDASGCGHPACAPVWVGTGFGNTGIYSTPAVSGGMVYVHGMDRYLYAFAASGCGAPTCGPLWRGSTDTVTEDESSPAVVNGFVYVGGGDCEAGDCGLWVFRAGGCGAPLCRPAWVDATEGGVWSSPAVAGGAVYFVGGASRLYVFDAAGCGAPRCSEPLWSAHLAGPGGGSSPAVAGGLVFVRSDTDIGSVGRIYAFATSGCGAATCTPVWDAPAGGDSASSPAVSGGMVFVGGNDTVVHAYGFS
jgi:hypothetical protein